MRVMRAKVRGLVTCLVMGICSLSSAHAEPMVRDLSVLPNNLSAYQVIDTRDLGLCETASLPGARCLPLTYFLGPDGDVVDFHALRWLLGTVGLSGQENVLLLGADGQNTYEIAELLITAGQHGVVTYTKDLDQTRKTVSGLGRSLSRETIYTAPMRIN